MSVYTVRVTDYPYPYPLKEKIYGKNNGKSCYSEGRLPSLDWVIQSVGKKKGESGFNNINLRVRVLGNN